MSELLEGFFKLGKNLLPLFLIIFLGSLGYHLIEHWDWFDSLYMTVITLTTIGYQETHTLSMNGKIFTIVLIFVGLGNFAYIIRNLSLEFLNPLFSGVLTESRMHKKIEKMKDHYIVCGLGRIGRDVIMHLIEGGKKVVIVDVVKPDLSDAVENVPFIIGDASNEDTLKRAGIDRAKGLVSSVKSEAENVFITLTARGIRPDLFIISRYEEDATQKKLMRAGASKTVNPYNIGSKKISQIILKPTISKILDLTHGEEGLNLSFEEINLGPQHPLIGKTIRESAIRDTFNVIIVAVEKNDGRIQSNPGANYVFAEKDQLVMIAEKDEMEKLQQQYAKN
ncbi:MAG: potassium channel protein [SAR324 cluster bacterium]|nr:potassium channel protein [SAR324 cluster bacterium]